MKAYGKELILDLHECDPATYSSREKIKEFLIYLCEKIDMERGDLFFWDYEGEEEEYEKAPAHLKGTSVVQFIMTSSIVMHCLDDMCRVYLNIFSCKDFDDRMVTVMASAQFRGRVVGRSCITRS